MLMLSHISCVKLILRKVINKIYVSKIILFCNSQMKIIRQHKHRYEFKLSMFPGWRKTIAFKPSYTTINKHSFIDILKKHTSFDWCFLYFACVCSSVCRFIRHILTQRQLVANSPQAPGRTRNFPSLTAGSRGTRWLGGNCTNILIVDKLLKTVLVSMPRIKYL